MRELIDKLYYLNRAIVSDGFEEALDYIGSRIPLKIHKVRSGTRCFDWPIPQKWRMQGGYIEDLKGNRLLDYNDHMLHVVVGSLPVDKTVSRDDLFEHLHWLDDQPERIPYIFKYYELDWGFCLAKNDLGKFQEDEYHVVIDSEYINDFLSIGECIIKGQVKESIAFLAHLDHPAQAQDDLSGVAVLVKLAEEFLQRLNGTKPYYTYRFLFVPETVGSIAYLATNPGARSSIRCGIFVEMAGVRDQDPVLQLSRKGDARIDRIMKYALSQLVPNHKVEPCFSVVINDDGVFNSPGIDIPAVSLSRSAGKDIYHHFPGYHTDLDNPENIDYDQMEEALGVLNLVVDIFEKDQIPIRNYTGVPHLSSAKLWIDRRINPELSKNIRYILYELDNKSSVFDICLRLGIDFKETMAFIQQMEEKNLVYLKRNNNW